MSAANTPGAVVFGPAPKSMKVNFRGMLGHAAKASTRGGERLHAFMLEELANNMQELGERYYTGDTAVVDEFLQLYSVAKDDRAAAVARAESPQPVAPVPSERTAPPPWWGAVFVQARASLAEGGASGFHNSGYRDFAGALLDSIEDDLAAMEAGAGQQAAPAEHAPGAKEILTAALAAGLADTYHCHRVWEAWSYNTMTADDFSLVDESATPAELADTILKLLPTLAPALQKAAKDELDAAEVEAQVLKNDLNTALGLLARWCVAVTTGQGWGDEFKDVALRDGPLRAMLDKAIDEAHKLYASMPPPPSQIAQGFAIPDGPPIKDRLAGAVALVCAKAPDELPDPHGCRACTHPDCARFDGPRQVECRAMADAACARPVAKLFSAGKKEDS